jgi:hypothetical protein
MLTAGGVPNAGIMEMVYVMKVKCQDSSNVVEANPCLGRRKWSDCGG